MSSNLKAMHTYFYLLQKKSPARLKKKQKNKKKTKEKEEEKKESLS
jgi:hypothetical protein